MFRVYRQIFHIHRKTHRIHSTYDFYDFGLKLPFSFWNSQIIKSESCLSIVSLVSHIYFSCFNCHYNSPCESNHYGKSCRWSKGPLPTGRPLGRRSRRYRINLTVIHVKPERTQTEKCLVMTSFKHFRSDFSCLFQK